MISSFIVSWWRLTPVFALAFLAIPGRSATVEWNILNLDNSVRETITFTTPSSNLFPDNAAEVHFADVTEWPNCGNIFSAGSSAFSCEASNGNALSLFAAPGHTWTLGTNTVMNSSVFCAPGQDPDNDCTGSASLGAVSIQQLTTTAAPEPTPAALLFGSLGVLWLWASWRCRQQ